MMPTLSWGWTPVRKGEKPTRVSFQRPDFHRLQRTHILQERPDTVDLTVELLIGHPLELVARVRAEERLLIKHLARSRLHLVERVELRQSSLAQDSVFEEGLLAGRQATHEAGEGSRGDLASRTKGHHGRKASRFVTAFSRGMQLP